METTISLPTAIWTKAADAAIDTMDDAAPESANREDGPAFWTVDHAARLRRIVADVNVTGETVTVTMPNGLWSVFVACFEVSASRDDPVMTDDAYDTLMAELNKIPGVEIA